ncbi:helix-turn-helix domain-containing protein [Rhodanobacter geophilus]|uniref:Helix-turn-helix domain-containing protein n=1 Tax=Rhodanobacter geophilus TaxID=3162488 RepID=A0ABV3QLI6_9GAMM
MTIRPTGAAAGGELGELLRYWRGTRGKSQIELSLDTGVSQRHLSFIESGRSAPGRQTLMNIAQGLEVPFRERNRLLLAAGFAPIYDEDAWNAGAMKSVNAALERVLRQHEPFPAVVMDRYWNVSMTNASTPRFFGTFVDLEAWPKPRNLLQLMFDPAGLRPFIAHWDRTAKSLIQRVHRESVGHVTDERTRDLLATLRAYPEAGDALRQDDTAMAEPTLPMVPLGFVKDGRVLNYFSMVTTVGAPQTIATQELRIECMYPADEQTDVLHRALMAGAMKP